MEFLLKNGEIKVKIENPDDFWYLTTIIDKGDLVKGKTIRKIKLGEKVIEGRKLAKHYDDLTLFENFNIEIGPKEKIGIIGTNGAGKTTLLKMLIKELLSDGGKVTHGETVKVSYFPQGSLEVLTGRLLRIHKDID